MLPAWRHISRFDMRIVGRIHGRIYEFHRYDGAGHGFWYYHTDRYRPRQAMDSWEKVFAFFGKHLSGRT